MGEDFVWFTGGVKAVTPAASVPALRKVREGRGTHFIGDSSEIKSPVIT